MGVSGTDRLDLSAIDQAFGDFADLYSDVLRVSVLATHEQIQLAYFDRRSELFTLLAKIDAKPQNESSASERFQAERKMDAVVLAVRILGDPEQRLSYDRIRQDRLLNRRRAANGQLPGHEPLEGRVGSTLDSVHSDSIEDPTMQHRSREEKHSSKHNRQASKLKKSRDRKSREDKAPREEKVSREEKAPREEKASRQDKAAPKEAKAIREERRETQHAHVHTEEPRGEQKRKEKKEKENRKGSVLKKSSRKEKSAPEPVEEQEPDKHNIVMQDTQDTETMTEDEGSLRDRKRGQHGEEERQDAEDQETYATDLDGASVDEKKETKKQDILSCITNSRILRNISDEISGACEDALVSVDQVFNAFTLTDKDIRAVTKRIDKAKKQFGN